MNINTYQHLHTLVKLQASVSSAHTQLQTCLADLDLFITINSAEIKEDLPPLCSPIHDAFVDLPERIQRAQLGKDTISIIEAVSRLTYHLSGGRKIEWAHE